MEVLVPKGGNLLLGDTAMITLSWNLDILHVSNGEERVYPTGWGDSSQVPNHMGAAKLCLEPRGFCVAPLITSMSSRKS